MLITVSLILDFSLCALVAMQGMVPISAAASEGEFAASLAPFPQLFPPVPDGFSAPGPWIPTLLPVPEMSKDLKVSKEGFSPCAEPSAAIPAWWNAGGRQQSVIASRTANTGREKVLKEMKPCYKWNQKEFSCLHEWSQDYPSSQDDKTPKFIYTFTLVFCQQ